MKAILEFDLPEERDEHEDALSGWKWRSLVENLDDELRSVVKYDKGSPSDEYKTFCDEMRGTLRRFAEEAGVEIV